MDAEGIDVTEAESAFSLSELKLSKSKVDDLENAHASSSEEEEEEDAEEIDELADSDEEYEELLESQMDKLYDDFMARRGEDKKTRKAVKRTKVAKRALAGEALVQDSEMYDGDKAAYHKMINAEEVRLGVQCAKCVCVCMSSPHSCYLFWVLLYSCSVVKHGAQGSGLHSCLTACGVSRVSARSYLHPTPLDCVCQCVYASVFECVNGETNSSVYIAMIRARTTTTRTTRATS